MDFIASRKFKLLSFFAMLVFLGILCRNTFTAYFFQDDWFTLRISQVKDIFGVVQFFVPRTDVIYYRPLGMQIPFFILQSFFGINPLPFHLLTFISHAVNILLVYFLIKLIKRDAVAALVASFMYAFSAAIYIPTFWSATYAFILGPLFFFLSFFLFILSRQKITDKYYIASVFVFILGLLTNEMVIVLPVILFLYQWYRKKIKLSVLSVYILPAAAILFTRFFLFPPPTHGTYQIGLSKDVLINLRAYLLWSFNWPEEMKAQFVTFWKVNSQFIKEFSSYFWSFVITLFISASFLYIIPVIFAVRQKRKELISLFIFGFCWFVIGLLPVLFFPQHSFSYYLPISLAGFLLSAASGFSYLLKTIAKHSKLFSILVLLIFAGNWIYSDAVTWDFNAKIHWAERRAKISKALVEAARNNLLEKKANTIYIQNTSENKLALNDQDAFRVIYDNINFVTIYGEPAEK